MDPKKRKHANAELDWHGEASDAFLSGDVSAARLQRLVNKATTAGAKGAEDLAKAGKSGAMSRNVHRDMHRALRKGSLWPKFYYADIPLWDEKQQIRTVKSHPFLLPHEWLGKATSLCDFSNVFADVANHAGIAAHIQKIASGLGSPWCDYIPLGLHSDGVPFGSQVFYSDSLELFSLNIPCGHVGMRIPFTSVQKNHLVKHETFNAILGVLAWSLKHLAFGTHPTTRHDGRPFGAGEQFRNKLGLQFKPAKALLVEIRADWVALKQVFQFPQQNENAGLCWMCKATPQNFRDCRESASWRHERLTAMSFHLQLKLQNKHCPLWCVPGVSCSIVVVDWLHCADLGVTADILGNILLELMDLFPGSDRNVRMQALWQEIRAEYDRQSIPAGNRFPNISLRSFWTAGKSPKLKGKAAHIRYVVPVMASVVNKCMLAEDQHSRTVVSCMNHLATCYGFLQNFDPVQLESSARKLALLYVALEKEQLDAGIQKRWKVKPKLHMFLELCGHVCLERHRGNPRNFWTYADESHGGTMKRIAMSRGGKNTSHSSAYRLLVKWVAQQDLLAFMD